MQDLKISLITVTFNAEKTFLNCIESVIAQDYSNIEYIVIDGGSTDKTINIAENYKHFIKYLVSEPDHGIYDAMNKGICLATGEVIGLLNADDMFAKKNILSQVAHSFRQTETNVVYGDLDYIDEKGTVVRKWRSGSYKRARFNFGWMPPHPTFYCKRILFDQLGCYTLAYGTAADYELMLRFLFVHQIKPYYLEQVMVLMRTGGASNRHLKNRIKGLLNDLKAMRKHRIWLPILTVILKPLRKITQYF
ncbi:glycosyltransferase [Mucilaginibacter sp. BJC16-A38]|uniref:glycosyltransferase family 2 protein n=1 Tax=Mucilaginibacter phenanthrenivorans TaxID=1234842 RepID=UPI0021575E79|nr:glycosyltransferase family 2 protein [Mucilaginibacter phenanthrenivorans]MCR8560206.1 glycosyltransferase [Mucilaginibacter phenanthrenivorans]